MFKKVILLVLFFIIIITGAYFTVNYDEIFSSYRKRELLSVLTPLKCDLNKQACKYLFKGHEVSVEFSPKPVPNLEEISLSIKNLGNYKDLNAKVYGLNMYMGTLVPKFLKTGLDYKAELFLSSCVLNIMRYRFEFFNKQEPIGFHFDIDIQR